MYVMLTFDSHTLAQAAFSRLHPHIEARMMPILRQVDATCGMAVRIDYFDLGEATARLSEPRFKRTRYYKVEGEPDAPVIEEIKS